MTSGYRVIVIVIASMLGVLFALASFGQPPRHCRYLVPVRGHPGVLGCSEYPRPIGAP